MEPRLKLKETLTDNLTLSSTDGQHEAVTQVVPGITVRQKAARSTLNVDYALQGLIYANEPANNGVYHKLSGNASQQLVEEHLSLAEMASITQQIINPRLPVPTDNINPGNVTNVVSYSVAPEARGSLGGVGDMNLKYRFGDVHYLDTDAASDSTLEDVAVNLVNGKGISRLSWNADYHKSVTDRSQGPNTHLESSYASLRYNLSQGWYMYAAGGRENNDLPSAQTIQNGSYWRSGLGWAPGPDFSIQASYGDLSKEAALNWTPLTRTFLTVTYLNQDVGVNPGITWSGTFRHRSPNTTWQAGYSEQAINVQRLDLTGQSLFVLVDATGNPILDPTTGQPILVLSNDFTLTDQDFIRKRGSVSLSATSAFTVSGLELFDETRVYQISGGSEQSKGITGTFVWKYASRTSLRLSGTLSSWSSDTIVGSDRLDQERAGLVRNIGPRVTGSVDYVHGARRAADPQRSYEENRIEAELTKHW